MNTCEFKHEIIAYDNARCPLCRDQDKITDLEQTIQNLKDDLRDLNEEIATNKRP